MPRPRRTAVRAVVAVTGALALACAGTVVGASAAPAAAPAAAPGAPGALSHFDLARKDCLGTSRGTRSKTWFTVADGVLSDVYYPTIDNTEVETLQYVVTDGSTFTDLQTRDTTYTVAALDPSGMTCRVTSTAKNGRYTITTDYQTDPGRDSVVLRTRFTPAPSAGDLQLYVRFDPTVNGNGGGGEGNGGADDAVVDRSTGRPVPVASDTVLSTNAANRDYAQPVYAALQADRPFRQVSSGYAGTASDGIVQLDADHRLAASYDSAPHGNVVQTAHLDTRRGGDVTLALGFGASRAAAIATSAASARADGAAMFRSYTAGWAAYDARLTLPPTQYVPAAQRAATSAQYFLSANVLKASEDKTFPGAVVASLASPWGQAVSAGDPANTYFGSYREVFARDLYETFTGLMAAGDTATATATVRFLFERQQQPDGSMPRNSLVNGKTAPDSFGVQLDEVAYPLLMARTVGLTSPAFYRAHLKPAADYLVAHGPAFGNERWEEQAGYSPSTIAAQIAGLAAVGAVAEQVGDAAGARVYRATADVYQRSVKSWTVTTTGPLSPDPYFIRLSKTGDPNAAITYNLGNGGPDADQRAVVDNGFLELPRLGVLRPGDPDVLRTLALTEPVLTRDAVPGGTYRYGTSTPGTEDGYGDCNTGDPTDCAVQGKPWAGTCDAQGQNKGSGHVWPVLTGERAENLLARRRQPAATSLWLAMGSTASGVGLIPEQAWEDPDLPPSPYGTPPECASIGFQTGKPAGSASPLTWSAAQFVRLGADLRAGRLQETPADTTARYLTGRPPAAVDVTITSPADGALVRGQTLVTGRTAPFASVDVSAVNVDIDGASRTASTLAGADGSFSLTVPVPPGTSRLTVVATTPAGGTGTAAVNVVDDVVPGQLLLDVADPDGDDNGPGTYAYPLAADFHPGAYDLQRFQVYDSGADTVTFRVQTRDLTPTFGSPLGAQLVDLHVYDPAGGPTSTAAAYPQRNYSVAPWNRLVEVQGFGQRFVDAQGRTLGPVQVRANAITRFITFTVDKAALGGTPGAGWTFAVVLTSQDGFSPDGARAFTATPGDYSFGVCPTGGTASPICAVDPATVPKAMDVITPPGVSQAAELDPTSPPVTIAAVPLGGGTAAARAAVVAARR